MQAQDVPPITPEMLEQNPALMLVLLLVMMVLFVGGVVCLASWIWGIYRLAMGWSLLPMTIPWSPRRWAFLDIVIIMGFAISLQGFLADMVFMLTGAEREVLTESTSIAAPPLEAIAAGGLASLMAVGLGIVWLQFRYRSGISHVGFGPISWTSLAASLMVGVAALPVIYLLMMLVTLLSQSQYEHPLIDSASDSGSLKGYLLGCFAAVIAAPIAEEFLFRVLLQGWLQSIPFKSIYHTLVGSTGQLHFQNTSPHTSPLGLGKAMQANETETSGTEVVYSSIYTQPPERDLEPAQLVSPVAEGVEPNLDGRSNPYAVQSDLSHGSDQRLTAGSPSPLPPIWPSVVVGVLFGLAHIEYGFSFLPLSVMGVVLGLLYRQTHSVWPCILMHAMLNGFSMLMLGFKILLMQAAN